MENNYQIYYKSSEKMKELDDESVQLVVTSPPYFLGKDYGDNKRNLENADDREDYMEMLKSVLKECKRVLKPDGKLCLNIVNPYTSNDTHGRLKRIPIEQELVLWLDNIGLDFMENVRWSKKRFGNSGTVFGSYPHPTNMYFSGSYESILVFRKWISEDYYSKRTLPDKEVKEASKVTKEEWKEWTEPIWEFDGVNKNEEHPAKFPYELPYRCVRLFTYKGDTVLDPFCGTGTSIKAALDTGRKGVGYEIENKYEDIIEDKISSN